MRVDVAVLALAVAAAGCAAGDSDAAERVEDTTGRRDSVAGVAAASLSDAGVLGLLRSVHAADSALGSLGAQRASTTELKEFARMILREHLALRRETAAVASSLGLTPAPPVVPPADAPEVMRAQLTAEEPGEGLAWDRRYVQYAIAMHEAAMENTARALAATRRPELRELIERSVPILDKHLAKARSLDRKLSGSPAPDGTPR